MITVKLSSLSLIVYDFDGVMTDNTVIVDQKGNESVIVSRADGLGISQIKQMGIDQIILSTEQNTVVNERSQKLGIYCIHGVLDKKTELEYYCTSNQIDPQKVIFVGNDINDNKVMRFVGWPICPKDAHQSIRKISKIILQSYGGGGVVREILDLIIDDKE